MAQNVLDTDSFGGSNGTALHTYNTNWIVLDQTNISELAIEGTPGVGDSGVTNAGNLRNGQTWTNDQWAELKIDGTTLADARFLVGVRCTQGTSNNCTGYMGGVHRDNTGGTYQIYKFTAPGTFTVLATASSAAYALNDVVNLQIVGASPGTLTLTVNGSVVAGLSAVTDSTYSTGSPALLLGSQATRLGGTWRAGSVGGAGLSMPSIGSHRPFPFTPGSPNRR